MLSFLESLEPFILGLHIVICLFLIIVILLQAGKGADMGAAFGAGSSQTLFGARGAATFLSKITTSAAAIFLLTSISLAAIHKGRARTSSQKSVVDERVIQEEIQGEEAAEEVGEEEAGEKAPAQPVKDTGETEAP